MNTAGPAPEAAAWPIHEIELQLAAARHLRWHPGAIEVTADALSFEGWALTVWEPQEQLRFLVNGEDVDELEWPLPSPDLMSHFGHLPGASAARFRARHRRLPHRPLFRDGFARLNCTSGFGEHAMSYRTAWYLADPAAEPAMPSPEQIERVIGAPDPHAYRLGGATTVRRFDAYLRHRFERPLASFDAVLDWGCGAGRLTRYLHQAGVAVTGVDIDADNVAGCSRMLPGGHFLTVGLWPPTALPDASFDLVIGLSVVTHLTQAAQHAWLAELRRITRPGGIVLLSVQGMAQSALYMDAVGQRTAHHHGVHVAGPNPQLAGMLPESDYYQDVRHTHDYVVSTWGEYFDVLDIVPALACHQDAVVMRRRAAATITP
jgi:SAM-dependent methyltransferase